MFFNTTNIHIAIIYEKMNDVNEEQAVFELLTLSNFKMWSSTALRYFSNYSIIITNDSDNIRISRIS